MLGWIPITEVGVERYLQEGRVAEWCVRASRTKDEG